MTEATTAPFDPQALLSGDLTFDRLDRMRRNLFQSLSHVESLREPSASWLLVHRPSGRSQRRNSQRRCSSTIAASSR